MEDEKERPNRTVNDFHSADDLQRALKSMAVQRSSNDAKNVSFMPPVLQSQQLGGPINRKPDDEDMSDLRDDSNSLDWILNNYDENSSKKQTLAEELERLQVLKSYLILDSERQESFERITGLAGRMFRCPMALVSFVDLGRQWFMSNRGLDVRETKRSYAFCAHAVLSKEDFLIVPDATKDVRFKDNPLVTGPPDIRFYAGAPLICPEGYRLGTLCVLDTKPRPQGLSFEEKQNLMEFANLAVQAAVDHRRKKEADLSNPTQLIASTAHDLVTPLNGVQLSLSLLMEDEGFKSKLSSQQREMISTALNCTDVIARICQTTIDSFRNRAPIIQSQVKQGNDQIGPTPIAVSDLVKNLYMVMDPFPKQVPLIIAVHPSVPEYILTDDLKVFRSVVNFLTNACAKTERGSVRLSINIKIDSDGGEKINFECEDTGPGVPVEMYPHLFRPYKDDEDDGQQISCLKPSADGSIPAVSQIQMTNSGLGLYSVAVHISSIGGQYGFRPRGGDQPPNGNTETGSIFWFSIPLVLSDAENGVGGAGGSSNGTRSAAHHMKNVSNTLNVNSRPGKMLKVLSTSTLTDEDARKVQDTFSRILEGDVSASSAQTVHVMNKVEESSESEEDRISVDAVPMAPSEKRHMRVLVIEDSLVVRKSLTRVLTKLGFEAVQAVDGMEGLKELKGSLFDVVLCDFLMPVMDGLDCVHQYRQWEATHRPFFRQYIIGISAHAGENDIEKGRQVGMDDFKPKPVTYKQLSDLHQSKELKVISDRLDEIATEGVMMMDTSMEMDPISGSSLNNAIFHASGATQVRCCLIAADNTTSDIAAIERAAKKKGWKPVVVHNGEDALRLLKIRNWDVVLLDEELPVLASSQCIFRFREWEEKNRVTRQKNVVLVSTSVVDNACGSESVVQLPFGFDAALAKPIRATQLDNVLLLAEQAGMDFGGQDIVAR
jgi:CheY-like chemotaxis protein/signal transduction histidine kinase